MSSECCIGRLALLLDERQNLLLDIRNVCNVGRAGRGGLSSSSHKGKYRTDGTADLPGEYAAEASQSQRAEEEAKVTQRHVKVAGQNQQVEDDS